MKISSVLPRKIWNNSITWFTGLKRQFDCNQGKAPSQSSERYSRITNCINSQYSGSVERCEVMYEYRVSSLIIWSILCDKRRKSAETESTSKSVALSLYNPAAKRPTESSRPIAQTSSAEKESSKAEILDLHRWPELSNWGPGTKIGQIDPWNPRFPQHIR
jgi:hypothetical protein